MQYVIMDMEWNNAYSKKRGGYMNEVIEIGAVKLDEQLKELGTFSQLVRPQIGKKLHSRTKLLTHITNEEIAGGESFTQTVTLFKQWIGNEPTLLLTWGDGDIRVLIDNSRYFSGSDLIPFLHYYADLQQFCQRMLNLASGQQVGLSAAAEQLGIPEDMFAHHRALDDSLLSAECLRRTFDSEKLSQYVGMCDDEFYARLAFKAQVISDIDSPFVDHSRMCCPCDICGGETERISDWKFFNQAFRAEFYCPRCDRKLRFHIRFKKYYDRVDIRAKASAIQPQAVQATSDGTE